MVLQVIVGGQFGSEGKGAIAAYLAAREPDLLAVRVAGPNAGHTVIGRCPPDCSSRDISNTINNVHAPGSGNHPWKLRQVPVAAVANPRAILAIGPGSEIEPAVLLSEVDELDAAGYRVSQRLWVDQQATVIRERHKLTETGSASDLVSRIGSTGKGVGAARAERLMRRRNLLVKDLRDELPHIMTADVADHIRARLAHRGHVQIEGTQGFGLGLHSGFYPFCTSSNCTAADFLAMAGCSPWLVPQDQLQVWVVFRTYPIRVAGNSGPLLKEETWEQIGQPEERTTVTNKVRRVGMWDRELARRAMQANGHRLGGKVVRVALTMCDYIVPALRDKRTLAELDGDTADQLSQLVASRSKDLGALIGLAGTGPDSVIDLTTEYAAQSWTAEETRKEIA